MSVQIYSRKRIAYVATVVSFIVCIGMLISFLSDYPGHIARAVGGALVFGIADGVVVLGFVLICIYGIVKVISPTTVEGSLKRTNGDFAVRVRNDLVISLNGKNYKFPLDSQVNAKLNSLSSDTLQVRMEVGAFGYPLTLEVSG